MLALHMPQTIKLAAEIAHELVSAGKLTEQQREAIITLGLCAAHNLLELNQPGSERALQIWAAMVRAWSDDENVRASLLLDFPRAGSRLLELKTYLSTLDIDTLPAPEVATARVALPRPAPSPDATFDVEARRWIEP